MVMRFGVPVTLITVPAPAVDQEGTLPALTLKTVPGVPIGSFTNEVEVLA